MTEPQRLFQDNYDHLFKRVYSYVRFRINNLDNVEDVVAVAIQAAYKHINRFDATHGSLEQFVIQITRNKVIDYWRAHKETIALDEVIDVLHTTEHVDQITTLDQQLAYTTIMTSLPHNIQAIFALHYEDGLTYEEIARLVDKKAPTIRKLFSNLHKRLRIQFEELNPYSPSDI